MRSGDGRRVIDRYVPYTDQVLPGATIGSSSSISRFKQSVSDFSNPRFPTCSLFIPSSFLNQAYCFSYTSMLSTGLPSGPTPLWVTILVFPSRDISHFSMTSFLPFM
jgi:hypothetical protein